MKTKRIILFRVGAVVLLLIIGAVMMVIGRGHTVYIDNVPLDYGGQTYAAPYKVVAFVDGEQFAKLYDKKRENRGMSTCIGQKFDMTLEITQEKGGTEETVNVSLRLPYSIDGIVVNLPAYLAGLPQEVYYSVFQPAVEEVEESAPSAIGDEILIDEPTLGDV